jgi:hypothetical protein
LADPAVAAWRQQQVQGTGYRVQGTGYQPGITRHMPHSTTDQLPSFACLPSHPPYNATSIVCSASLYPCCPWPAGAACMYQLPP